MTTPATERTRVVIVGAGPAGLLLSHLLDLEGIESVLVENRSPEYVLGRIRAGVLESSSVDLLTSVGLGERIAREGDEHRGIYLQWTHEGAGERHHVDFVDHVGRSVWIYGQTEVTKDLMAARETGRPRGLLRGLGRRPARPRVRPAVGHLHRRATAWPAGSRPTRSPAATASTAPSRPTIPDGVRRTWERTYPYAWLGVLADVAPSTDELIYAWHPDGFALHSMRSATVSRLYLQVPPDEDVAQWSDDRIWTALATRLGHGQDGWSLQQGPITEKSVLPMRSFVATPMRHGRLFLAGDAAHIVPPTGAKGLNLAIADVTLLARALRAWLVDGSSSLVDSYSDDALRRVWRCTHFSWWMTSMLHTTGDPFDAQLQLSQLRWVTGSEAGAAGLAENYAGLPIGF